MKILSLTWSCPTLEIFFSFFKLAALCFFISPSLCFSESFETEKHLWVTTWLFCYMGILFTLSFALSMFSMRHNRVIEQRGKQLSWSRRAWLINPCVSPYIRAWEENSVYPQRGGGQGLLICVHQGVKVQWGVHRVEQLLCATRSFSFPLFVNEPVCLTAECSSLPARN